MKLIVLALAAGTAYASSDDDEDVAADGSLPAQWWKEIVTLNLSLIHI